MNHKPLILISNDDGINAPGLKHLIDAVAGLGEIVAVAPAMPYSGGSSSITVNAPLRIASYPDYNGAKMYSVTGTPVDCVKLALHTLAPRRPAVMFSGINHGSNAGSSLIYSGTMGAAMEGCMLGSPSVGYSLLDHSLKADFGQTLPYIRHISERVLAEGLPAQVCLNVNFPANVRIEGMKVCRSALSHWTEEYKEYIDPHGKPYYWLTGKIVNEEPGCDETDLYWLDRNYATVVPVTVDQNATSEIKGIRKMLE